MPVDNDAEQRYGSFIATQDADSRTELDIEQKLFSTSGLIYTSRTLEDSKYSAIGTLKYARNFLQKYVDALPENGLILEEIDTKINIIRLSENIDKEVINQLFSDTSAKILTILGKDLGFRKKRVMSYKWTEKAQARIQIPNDPNFEKIVNKKKTGLAHFGT